MTDAVTQVGCNPWCDALLTFEDAADDVKKEGDVYEVGFGRGADRPRTAAIRDAVHYQTIALENCSTCTFSSVDHRGDAPVGVGP